MKFPKLGQFARSMNKKKIWFPWSKNIQCPKCDMRNVCKHIDHILKDHNDTVDYELRFRCPVLDKRTDDRAPIQ